MGKRFIAIDFGTTQTSVSVLDENGRDGPHIHTIDSHNTTPTAMELDNDGNIISFGRDAIKKKKDKNSSDIFYNFKPWIGTGKMFDGRQKNYHPEELSLFFLKHFRGKIEDKVYNGKKLKEQPDIYCIIGYPAGWSEQQKRKLKKIAEDAGFPNVVLCKEPWAVICYYHKRGTLQCDKAKNILVYDFGGGTTDLAIEQMLANGRNGKMYEPKSLAAGGDPHLGGMNFDEILSEHFIRNLGLGDDPNNFAHKYPKDNKNIELTAKILKEELSNKDTAEEETPMLDSVKGSITLKITREKFDSLCTHLIARFDAPVNEVLGKAKLTPEQIDHVILAGGSSQMPYVKDNICKIFPAEKIIQSDNPVEAVVNGLAIYAETLFGSAEQPETRTEDDSGRHSAVDDTPNGVHDGIHNVDETLPAHDETKRENQLKKDGHGKKRKIMIIIALIVIFILYMLLRSTTETSWS